MKRTVLIIIALLGLLVTARSFVSVLDPSAPVSATAPTDDRQDATHGSADDPDLIPDYEFICWFLPRWVCEN
ncbi:hypothetical protein ACWGTO_28075 [Mesorhizobium sp. PL10]